MQKELYNNYIIDQNANIYNKKSLISISSRKNKRNGSYQVNLYINGKKTTILLHKLVAMAFINDYNSKTDIIRHKDNDLSNNSLSNLEVYRYKKIFPKEDDSI